MSQSAIRACALSLERLDTHAHLEEKVPALEAVAQRFDSFDTTAPLIDSKIYAEGCRVLYGIDPGVYLRSDAPPEIFTRARELRARGDRATFASALDQAHIAHMLAFCDHEPAKSPLRTFSSRINLLAYIDPAILGDYCAYSPDFPLDDYCYYDRICGYFGQLTTLPDYLDALDAAIDTWRAHGVVGMKTAMAYTTGLAFSDPSPEEARAAFAKKDTMTPADIRTVQDFAFRHALLACQRHALPVVIHTGFQIWGHANLAQSNPLLLHNLLIDPRYKDLTFVLLHGGNPYVGETAYLAGMFPNVILDFTWIAWMSRTRFRSALAEWLEVVPATRFCWGSDCSSAPETIAGINHIVRGEIANVLEDLAQRHILDEPTALDFLQQTYVETPKRVFGL